jgi:hypothetical protein
MLCLLLGNLVHWLVRPSGSFGQDMADGVFGLFIGLSIALNLASLRSRCRREPLERLPG